MASREEVEELKRRHGRRLMRIPGVSGVGVERDPDAAYVLVVHVKDDTPDTRAAVKKAAGDAPVRIVKSGPFVKR